MPEDIVLKKDKFTKSTLGGCIVEEKDNSVLISKEFCSEDKMLLKIPDAANAQAVGPRVLSGFGSGPSCSKAFCLETIFQKHFGEIPFKSILFGEIFQKHFLV